MSLHLKNVLKEPVWLKRYEHLGWMKSKGKWKASQTEIAVANYLAVAPDSEASKIIFKIVGDEAMPEHARLSIFRRYRREKDDNRKGRITTKNVIVMDGGGNVRDDLAEGIQPAFPLTSVDIEHIVDLAAAEDTDTGINLD